MYKVTRKSRKKREPPHIYPPEMPWDYLRPLRKPRILYLRGICILHSLRWVFFQSLLTPPALTTVQAWSCSNLSSLCGEVQLFTGRRIMFIDVIYILSRYCIIFRQCLNTCLIINVIQNSHWFYLIFCISFHQYVYIRTRLGTPKLNEFRPRSLTLGDLQYIPPCNFLAICSLTFLLLNSFPCPSLYCLP